MGVSWRRTGREILSSGADKDLKYWNFENGDRLAKEVASEKRSPRFTSLALALKPSPLQQRARSAWFEAVATSLRQTLSKRHQIRPRLRCDT